MVCNFCFSNSVYNKANIFLGLIEYELNSLLGASHLVDYISVHIRFDLETYLLIIVYLLAQYKLSSNLIGSLDVYCQRILPFRSVMPHSQGRYQ